ncbi:MAG: PIN domain-containing protein [Promethearchaeota archaeon]
MIIYLSFSIENIEEIPLTSNIIIIAIKLREKYELTYFNSLHCASTLQIDDIIISSDKEFKNISNLKVIEPKNFT